jgi:hypothetical protein
MAGQNPKTLEEIVDAEQQYVTVGPIAAGGATDQIIAFPVTPPAGTRGPNASLFIDSVRWNYRVAGGSGAAVRLLRRTSTDTDVASTVTANRAITNNMSLTGTANVTREATVLAAQNEIEPGDSIVADFSGTQTGLADLFITIRYSTRRR